MSLPGLTLIGERINPGFASSKALLDAEDIPGLQHLAQQQASKGAHYLTINVGDKSLSKPEFVAELIRAVQAVVDLPLAFDNPSLAVQELCLKSYDTARARGRKPIVNSVTELRLDLLELLSIRPFRLVVMASERIEDGEGLANETAEQIHATARRMVARILGAGCGMVSDDILIDVSIFPLAADMSGKTKRALEAIRLIGGDAELQGVHQLVGLSNLGIMLPKTSVDGRPLSTWLESAFLTLAMPLGLDTILGTAGRGYRFLPPTDLVFRSFQEIVAAAGVESLALLRTLCRGQ
jgi:cobalamin-dependent methionine synthase I